MRCDCNQNGRLAARPKRFSPGDLTYCCGLYKLLSQIAISLFSCVLFGTEVSLIVEIRDKKEFLAIPMRSRGTASSVVVRTRKYKRDFENYYHLNIIEKLLLKISITSSLLVNLYHFKCRLFYRSYYDDLNHVFTTTVYNIRETSTPHRLEIRKILHNEASSD